MVEELWSELEFDGYFYETGLGMVVRTIQYQTAIYSLEANVSRQIGENTFRFAVTANMSLNR